MIVSVVFWFCCSSLVSSGAIAAAEGASLEDLSQRGRSALLIGVDRYVHPEIPDLHCCGPDVAALREALVLKAGFAEDRVVVLHDDAEDPGLRPSGRNIARQLCRLLDDARQGELVLIAFSGHGVYLNETSYLCPSDADLDRPEKTLVPVPGLYRLLSERCRAEHKLVWIDACRTSIGVVAG